MKGEAEWLSSTVISTIQRYGVPYTDYYLKQEGLPLIHSTPNPVALWVASYEGEGNWSIQGAVVVSHVRYKILDRDSYYLTTWTFNEDSSKIRLVEFLPCPAKAFRVLEERMEKLAKLRKTYWNFNEEKAENEVENITAYDEEKELARVAYRRARRVLNRRYLLRALLLLGIFTPFVLLAPLPFSLTMAVIWGTIAAISIPAFCRYNRIFSQEYYKQLNELRLEMRGRKEP